LPAAVVGAAGFLAFPASIGIAVLRFRLYDLDVVVRKTLVAGVLAVFVALVYAAAVAAGSLIVGSNDTTLAVVAAVVPRLGVPARPVRARRFADRLVYGKRANPYEVLTEFSSRVGGAYATEDVVPRMAQILGEGAGPSRAGLAARRSRASAGRLVADRRRTRPSVHIDGDAMPRIDGEYAVPVRDRGELLGALSVRMPANDPMTPAKERLVADLASQAGLVLRNVGLVEELRESRRRLVAAQDHERRKLERNIHDGAQQQLVALAVKARLARQLADRDPTRTAEMLQQIEDETTTALDDLRDLARGIYPPLLADKGLAAALQAQARKAPIPVGWTSASVGSVAAARRGRRVLLVLEALQNVAKYATGVERDDRAPPRGIDVLLRRVGRRLRLRSELRVRKRLQGVTDRLAAIGGTFEVESAPGPARRSRGHVPIRSQGPAEAVDVEGSMIESRQVPV
jgi:signal transduction histidine kinase